MEIIIIIAFIVVVILFSTPGTVKYTKKSNCPPHRWSWKGEDQDHQYMSCDECGQLVGGDYEEKTSGKGKL